jgi:ribosomal-protein-alanine N-acetyltransferase
MDGNNPPAGEFRIRPIETAHVGELIRLGESANLSPWSADHYIDELKNPNAIMLRLVSDENAIVGFIVARIVNGGVIEVTVDAEIYNIMIDGEYRRRGLAQVLFDSFLTTCRKKNVANVWLEVRESNTPAIRFYEKNGFSHMQTRRNFYRDPLEHALLMRLSLDCLNE